METIILECAFALIDAMLIYLFIYELRKLHYKSAILIGLCIALVIIVITLLYMQEYDIPLQLCGGIDDPIKHLDEGGLL